MRCPADDRCRLSARRCVCAASGDTSDETVDVVEQSEAQPEVMPAGCVQFESESPRSLPLLEHLQHEFFLAPRPPHKKSLRTYFTQEPHR